MRLDTANRNFYGLVAIAAAPFLLVGVLGCGVLSVTAYRVIVGGPSTLGHGMTGVVAGAFLAVSALGVFVAFRSLLSQLRATARLTTQLRERQVPVTERLQALVDKAGIARIELVDDRDPYSLTIGFTAPRIVISTSLVDRTSDQELASILDHERYHVTNRDPLKIAVARAISAGLVFLPATGHLLDRYLTGRELNADNRALRRCGRSALAGALLRASGGPTAPALGAAAAFGGDHLLDVRIAQLETETEPDLQPIPSAAVAVTILGLGAMFAGLVATAIAVDTPTLLDTTPTGLTTNLAGGLACAAMWIIGVRAVRSHLGHTPKP